MHQCNNALPKNIVVEGNIGSGKSTLLAILKKRLLLDVVQEPTDQWQSIGQSENLLNLFYTDTSRWAYTFQSYAFLTRVQAILRHLPQSADFRPVIIERSVYCDRFCFAKNCYESGNMSEIEWHIYQEWFSWLVRDFTPKPSGFIYLRCDPVTAHQRITLRNRHEELGIPVEYLKSLHQKHDDWLIHKKHDLEVLHAVPVLTIECDKDFENDQHAQDEIIGRIEIFVQQLCKNDEFGKNEQVKNISF